MQPDSNKAHQYYIQAANENFPRGLNNLASFYQLDPQYKNPEKSLLYFKKAI
jgi:TPR repeat protein